MTETITVQEAINRLNNQQDGMMRLIEELTKNQNKMFGIIEEQSKRIQDLLNFVTTHTQILSMLMMPKTPADEIVEGYQ